MVRTIRQNMQALFLILNAVQGAVRATALEHIRVQGGPVNRELEKQCAKARPAAWTLDRHHRTTGRVHGRSCSCVANLCAAPVREATP